MGYARRRREKFEVLPLYTGEISIFSAPQARNYCGFTTLPLRAEVFFSSGLAGSPPPIIPEPEKRKIPERKIP